MSVVGARRASQLLLTAAISLSILATSSPDATLAGGTGPLPLDLALSSGNGAGGEPALPSVTPRTPYTVAANQRPPKPQVTDQTAYVGRLFTYTVPAVTDPDSDRLDYNAAMAGTRNRIPEWISFNTETRTFRGKPREEAEYEILVSVSDGFLESEASFTLTVETPNDPPVAGDDTATVAEGGTLTITAATLLTNDSDPESATLSVTAVGGAVNGSVTLSANTATYVHDGSETTSGSFTYTVSDGAATDTATVTITVTPVNDAPVAPSISNQSATEGVGFSFQAPAFTDAEGDTLSYIAALSDDSALPSWLTFTASTRTFAGTPQEADTPASLAIRVTATDDGTPSASSSATFTLTVAEVNDPPVPGDDTATVAESGTLTITAATLLANDSDPESATLTVTAVSGAVNGTATLATDKASVTYVHDGSETTSGSFTYTVSDGSATATATANITVSPVNDAPVAPSIANQAATEGVGFSFQAPAFTDPESSALTYTAALADGSALPSWLTFTASTRTFAGTPQEADTPATLSIKLTASDGSLTTSATFTLTVVEVNDPPVAGDDTATVAEGGTLTIAASTLLANDSDPESATLSITAVGGAVNGTVSLSTDKATVTYVHDGSETTSGSFTYTVSDGAATDTATVSITVSPVNDAPVAPSISNQTATEAMSFTFQAPAFTDPDCSALTYTAALSDGHD